MRRSLGGFDCLRINSLRVMDEDNPFVSGVTRNNASYNEIEDHYESSDCSDSSSEGPQEIDAVVREDMGRLESIFDNMGFKFRMIDRIGEGQYEIV